MKIINKQTALALIGIGGSMFCALSSAQAAGTGPECRGVAAGVVAGMRAAGEVNTQEASEIAIIAARRACSAAREELAGAPISSENMEAATETEGADTEGDGKVTLWDLLSGDQESKPGNERLKRLRQQ